MNTVVSRALAYARSQPDAPALVDVERTIPYGELFRPVRAVAGRLQRMGVRAGDTVALSFAEPDADPVRSIRILYALAHLGAVVLPLYPDVPVARRLDLMARFDARWLVPREPGEAADGRATLDPAALETGADGPPAPRGDDTARPFLYHFSGGTTGTPKAVLLDHARFLQNMLAGASGIGARGHDRLVSPRRWPTLPGLRYLLRSHAIGGALADIEFPDTRQKLEDAIRATGASILMASPWQLRRLLASPPPAGPRAPELNVLYLVGGAVTPAEIRSARELVTKNVYATYAASEVGLISALRPGEDPEPAGNYGRLIEGVEGRVTDAAGHPLPPGAMGSLGFRAPWFPDRYAGNEQATRERIRGGWFHPGDTGTIDAAGRVIYFGRTDDLINFGGVKLAPADIEPVIAAHPDIADVAVVGVPNAMAGAVPVALVVLRREVPGDSLIAFCRERLDATQIPSGFIQVPEILRSPDGKIQRNAMIERYGLKTENA